MVVSRKEIPKDYGSFGRWNWKESDVEFQLGWWVALKDAELKIWREKLTKINRIVFNVAPNKNCGPSPVQRAARLLALKNRKDFVNSK